MRIGDYEVVAELGRGGAGAVYRARRPGGPEVALKLLLGVGEQAARRFARETRALRQLDHPNLVRLLDVGEHQGHPFLVLELVDGESLEDLLHRRGRLGVDEALGILRQVADALDHAHAQGLLHRDVKPSNVLLDREGRARLTDFGLVRDQDASLDGSRLSRTGSFLGTPGYWAPEQARGDLDALGSAADVYGAGATLFAMLTGRPPVEVGSIPEALARADEPPPPPSRLAPGLPRWLDAVVLRALALDPADRYSTPGAFADALATGPVGAGSGARWAGGLVVLGGALAAAVILGSADARAGRASASPTTLAAPSASPAVPGPSPSSSAPPASPEEPTGPAEPPASPVADEAPPPPSPARDPVLDGLISQGWELHGAGRFAESAARFQEAVDHAPASRDALQGLTTALYRTAGAGPRALAAADALIAVAPEWPHAWRLRALVRLDLLRDTEGGLGDVARSLELETDPIGRADGLHMQGLALMRLGRAEEALPAVEESVRLCRDRADGVPVPYLYLQTLGALHQQSQRFAAAHAAFDECVRLEPRNVAAWLGRAQASHGLGDWERSLADAGEVLRRQPGLALAYLIRAEAFELLGQREQARDAFARVLTLEEVSPPERELAEAGVARLR